MAVIQRPIGKCDQCGKEVEFEEGHLPDHWLEIAITEWWGSSGTGILSREVCSNKCALDLMHALKKIPKEGPVWL